MTRDGSYELGATVRSIRVFEIARGVGLPAPASPKTELFDSAAFPPSKIQLRSAHVRSRTLVLARTEGLALQLDYAAKELQAAPPASNHRGSCLNHASDPRRSFSPGRLKTKNREGQ